MVQKGRAVVYCPYLDGRAADRDRYLQAEQQAAMALGILESDQSHVMPWNWRQQHNGSAPASQQPETRPTNRGITTAPISQPTRNEF